MHKGEIDASEPGTGMADDHPSSALITALDSAHDAPAVREVMRGIRNRQKGRPSPKKAPLNDTDLTLLVDTLDTTTLAGARDRALLLVAFAAALRRSELVGIDVEHLITTAARNRADVFAIAAQSRHRSLDTVREYVNAETRFDDHPGLKMFQ